MIKNKQGFLTLPLAIIIAGIIIAGAVIYSSGKTSPPRQAKPSNKEGSALALSAVTSSDHVLGNRNAKVKIVEYSDTECPFCKRFHNTMLQIMSEYDQSGDVAWVYRHFPLDGLHLKARKEAEATECASELGGNEKFWAYTNRLFEITPSNDGLSSAELPKIAEYVGLDRADFEKCLSSGRTAKKVEEDYQDGLSAGASGTPYSVAIAGNKKLVISGAQPYSTVKSTIDSLLK